MECRIQNLRPTMFDLRPIYDHFHLHLIYDQFTTNLQPIYASIYDLFCARAMRGCQPTPTRERPILIDSESTENLLYRALSQKNQLYFIP